jgi:hypothetical protein
MSPGIQHGPPDDTGREVSDNPIVANIKTFESLTLPNELEDVPKYAGGLHWIMDSTSYPCGLRRKGISVQLRSMVNTDVFEALIVNDGTGKRVKNYPRVCSLPV